LFDRNLVEFRALRQNPREALNLCAMQFKEFLRFPVASVSASLAFDLREIVD